jgi:hypothetical protein
MGWETMKDYSEALIIIQELRKKAQDAAAEKNWSLVCDIADTIIDTALRLGLGTRAELDLLLHG